MFTEALILSVTLIAVHKAVVFVHAIFRKNNSLVDIYYGLAFVLLAYAVYYAYAGGHFIQVLVTALVTVWGVRLSWRIFRRNKDEQEDWRYAQWRKEWMKKGVGYFLVRSVLQVFVLQGIIVVAVALPVVAVNSANSFVHPNVFAIVGGLIWLFGFAFEVVADAQLDRFKKNKNNAGAILTTGLFRYCRRPNYFGEAVMWWGIWVISLATGQLVTIISPIVITYILYFISGPMLEKMLANNKAYQEHAKKTNYFFPWIPKETSDN